MAADIETLGLSSAQVAERIARGQLNDVPRRASRSVTEIVRSNVLTLFNAIIGTLCAVVLIFGQPQDALFGLIIVANTGIGIIQELRAKRTLDRLALVGEEPVRVLRDGRPTELHPSQIVLGDQVLLGSGDRIVVDGAVTGSAGLEIDESLLTGEADPVPKTRGDEVLSGSFVTAGTGSATVTKVGRDAYAARLAEEASRFSLAHSELLAGINRFLTLITWLIIPVAIVLTVSQLLTVKEGFGGAVSGTVAGIVTMIPEGLVLLTSIAFAVGVIRLGARNCLVQELPAIEVLARVDVLCLDKTGTLTEGGMHLDEVRELAGGPEVRRALAELAALEERPNDTLKAIAEGLREHLAVPQAAAEDGQGSGRWRPVHVVPFSSARKWSGASFDPGGAWVLGAPDVLLPAADAARLEAEKIAASGLRVLVAGQVDPAALPDPDSLAGNANVRPAALIVLRQRVRAQARDTLRYFEAQGVAIKVISGDNAASVGAVAADLGIPGAAHPLDARTLPGGSHSNPASMDPADLRAVAGALDANSVIGRVSPQQKRVFVAALQSAGHTVAMTGDGVNDVLALKDADLGVAMGSGSGATRAVAKVVLLDDNFASLPHVVAEGRRVLGNIERVATLFLTKTVYAILLAVAVSLTGLADLAGLKGLEFPFLPRHLTLISTLTIGVPAFFLALAPNTQRARPGFVPRVLSFAVPAGIFCAAATFTSYLLARLEPSANLVSSRSTATIALFAVATCVLALVARPYTWWRLTLVACMAAGFILVLAIPFARNFFLLNPGDIRGDIAALAMAGIAAVGLTVGLAAVRRLPGQGPRGR
ncbi:MAG: HAD-IC family P-type ATPase [Micromonosporaceae bacterium]